MRVTITTTVKGNYLGYRIAVAIDGEFSHDMTATPAQVLKMRNAEIDRWCDRADKVTANAVPTIAGLTTGATEGYKVL